MVAAIILDAGSVFGMLTVIERIPKVQYRLSRGWPFHLAISNA